MWKDIRSWIMTLYLITGLLFSQYALLETNQTLSFFKNLIWAAICMIAWLPMVIVGIIAANIN